jgi:large subunit ribosomal protein L1
MAKEKTDKRGAEAAGEGAPGQREGKTAPEATPAAAEGAAVADAAQQPDTKPKKAKKASAKTEEGGERRRGRGRSMRGKSKRHVANVQKVVRDKRYVLDEAIKVLKSVVGGTKFTQTVNLVMHLGIDPKQADQMIRGALSLPKGIGSTKRVIAFCEGEDIEKAKAAGAIEAGLEDLIKKVADGWTDFDVSVSHPRAMGKVGKLGRVLGPQGKMPSPKNGTVTADVGTAVREFSAGKVEFRNDAGGNVHAVVGRADFSEEDLKENISAFINHIRRLKPATSKGTFIKRVCLSGTMSPAVELEVAQQ